MVKSQNGIAKSNKKAVSRTLRLVRIAIFVALIIVGAFVKFPIGIVPVSMQFAFCMFASLMLGGLDSFICVAIYIVMGLIGIPVFSAGGGFAYVLQPTFGYILGFLIAAPVGGFIARVSGLLSKRQTRKIRAYTLGQLLAAKTYYFERNENITVDTDAIIAV